MALLVFATVDTAPTAAAPTAIAPGSLIIPMDTDTSGNHAAFNQNNGMWKAYGLLFRLLQNDIPVRWAILEGKTGTTNVDFSVASVRDKRTNTALGSWDYRGGPFIIDSADAARAMPIITAWWAANGNQPNVHEALAGFSADINVTLRSAPRIANEAINAGISIAYYNAAGIPDLNGRPWSTTSPNILTQAQIAAGALFEQGATCLRRKFDVFVTPHNGGYSYSLSDPSNLGTRTYAQLDTFVQQGGGWTALCHSILSNENAIADLTRNGANAVKALFRTSLPGGKPGGFLTTTGFPTIDNTGGAWTVNPSAADLPVAQLVPPTATPGLPGGSVQTWPSPGNPGAPIYWSNTERVAFFDTAGVDHDHIIAGTYHDGTGLGKVTYIGGHSFSTSVPYSANAEAPYLRAFYNSLFFNGSAVAKLDLTHSPETYPQHGTGQLSVSVTNTGGSVATNVGNVSVTLAPGFTYAGTTAGPVPDVSVDGRTLTWIGGLGDIAGGASAVTFNVDVSPTVSSTIGVKNLGQFHATYGDVFGEGFTADICRDITVTPTPAPRLTKTPAHQGPVRTGAPVTWTLSYGNPGAAALLSSTLEDRLPAGFAYVSSSSSPNLGAPTVIPAAGGTIVRWNIGTIPANTPSAGTVTITARAGPVTSGSGTPPEQTFSNNATLAGKDAGGNTFRATASADVDVQALDITLDKQVDKTFLSPLPGTVTYTLRPRSDSSDLLEDVRVIDPLPAGVVSPPVSVGQGGSYGAYTPIPAQPGNDPGPPVLDTAMSVSTNVVSQGASVTVTLNVHSSTSVTGVSPTDIGIAGGSATCTGPSPASATVPPGGAGFNFTWSCTLNDLGEYIFSAGATDAGETTSWPTASSASVLSTAGGGPNVVTWNLGSSTPAVGGAIITSGFTPGIYGLRGATQPTFQKFDLQTNTWGARQNTLQNVAKGGALAANGNGTIWELTGNGTQTFNAYDIATNTWTARQNTGTNVGEGGALVYLNGGVYALFGNGLKTFKRYDPGTNSWTQLADTPAAVKKGGSLTTDGINIYAFRGAGTKDFWRYNVATNTWTVLASNPDNINWGGALVRVGNFIYATIGGGKNRFYRYDIAANTWTLMANTPANVADGGSLTTDGTFVYAFQGKTTAFWRYNIATNQWIVLAPFTANTGQGGAIVFDPGRDPQGRFSSLSSSRSLAVTGDVEKVTLTLTASAPANNVVPGSLTVTPTNGASCSSLTGPVLTSADDDIAGPGDLVTYEWTCTVAAGANPGTLLFSTNASADGGLTFASATSNSAIVTPPLTFTVTVPNGAPNPVLNLAMLSANGQTAPSQQVATATGSPTLTIVKSNNPGDGEPVNPGDPITYSMTVENTGTGIATGVVVTDPVPANSDFVSCSGGSSCNQAAGTVSWTLGTLAPGETATVSFVVSAQTTLAISDTPYTISNAATVDSDQTTPVQSNTVTNEVQVLPEIVKTVSASEAAPGDPLTYTLTVSNPGAAFTADITDDVPAGTTFTPGSCTPPCSFAGGTVTWGNQTIPHGTTTFSFAVTVDAGAGGMTVTNAATLDPTSPDVDPIESNPTNTEIGPSLAIVKSNNPTGQVQNGDQITYSLFLSNESNVTAHDTVVTDPVPVGTSFGTCSTPVGSCGESGGVVTFNLGDVPGRATITVTFTVTVGTPPVGTLEIPNQAQATTSDSSETAFSNTVVNPLPFPSLLLRKSATPSSYDSVGDQIHYAYVVTNNSTTTTLAGPVTVTDDKATVTCPPGDLAPLASKICTATYSITQADLNAGSVTNLATAHAAGTDSNEDTATVTADQHPGLTLTKHANDTSYDSVGDVLHYSYTVENTGNVALPGPVTITDDRSSDESCPSVTTVGNNDANLDPGETITCTATYTVTQADITTGSVTNTATAHAGGTDSNQDTATVMAAQVPHITLLKTGPLDRTVAGPPDRSDVGDQINYTLTAINDGNVPLTGVTISDPSLGPLNCTPSQPATLAPGETLVCTGTHTLDQPDIDAGHVDNVASVSGTDPNGGTVTDTDDAHVQLGQAPHLTLTKEATLDMTQVAPATRPDSGDVINYTLTAKNDGNVTLTGVEISDLTLGTLNCAPPQPVASLAPGDSLVCTATRTLDQTDVDAGHAANSASVDATDPNGEAVSDNDDADVPLAPAPHVTLVKEATLDMTQAGPADRADAGDVINYTLTATNDGNVTLTGVTIADPSLPSLVCAPPQPATLAPADVLVCTGSRTLDQADINRGFRANIGGVSGTDPHGTTVTDTDNAVVRLPREPHLTLTKDATLDMTQVPPATRPDAGDVINYTLTAVNDGNVTVTAVAISDPALGPLNCVPAQPAALEPGDSLVCTATRTLDQTDIDAEHADNVASVDGTDPKGDPVSDTADADVPLAPFPHLTLVKQATLDMTQAGPPDRVDVGDVINYTLTATNDGNVTLTGVSITDPSLTLNCTPNQPATLAPDATLVCTGTHTLNQADINAGHVANSASVDGTDPDGGPVAGTDDADVPLTAEPALTLTKDATEANFDSVGDVLHYSYTVENAGNVSLAGPVTITDDRSTDESCPDLATVGNNDGNLDPGESVVCTATYTITQDDLNSASVTNTATAHIAGTDSNDDSVTVGAVQQPALTLTKAAAESDYDSAGDVLHYTYTVQNTGNVALAGPVTVTDDKATDESCPDVATVGNNDANLDPGESITCSATYTVTQADLDAGSVTNTATAHAAGTDSNADHVTVTDIQHPDIQLEKTSNADPATTTVGDTITYTFKVTNSGNITITSYTISDPHTGLSPIDCPGQPSQLAPGQSATCTATYTVTQADLNNGTIVNTAIVDGTTDNAGPVDSFDELTINLTPLGTLQIVKRLVPSTDGGRFDLNINGGPPEATGVGDGGQTPAVPVSPHTANTVSESAASGTEAADYTSQTTCTRDGTSIPNVDPSNIRVGLGEAVVCTITNTLRPSGLGIAKSAPAIAHDGDTITYGIAVTNTGGVPLLNVNVTDSIGVTGSTCQGGPTLTGGDTNGDGRLDTTETWTYDCTYVVQHADEDATSHIVDVARATATDRSGRAVGPVEATASTLITHPAISLAKTGPGKAVAGTAITYRIVITNTGDTSFPESDVKVTDPLCGTAPLKPTGKNGDATPTSFDPGDRWNYECRVRTSANGKTIRNSATVRATDVNVTSVNAVDTVDTQLVLNERQGGGARARLTGSTGCVYRSFLATVRGTHIARVTFRLDGRVVKQVRNRKRTNVIRARIRPSSLRGGTHKVTARVTFLSSSRTRPKTLRLSFTLCPKQVVAPQFTG